MPDVGKAAAFTDQLIELFLVCGCQRDLNWALIVNLATEPGIRGLLRVHNCAVDEDFRSLKSKLQPCTVFAAPTPRELILGRSSTI